MTERRQSDAEPRLRLFVAVELPETWLAGLDDLQAGLRRRLDPTVRLRWVRPEAIHLTLKFIGEVGTAMRAEIEAALAKAVPQAPQLRLESGSLGIFGDRRVPRVVWLGLSGDIPGLRTLAASVDTCLHTVGLAREKRPFASHLTLARVPEGLASANAPVLEGVIAATAVPILAPFEVRQVSLMLSHPGAGGARYERLAAFPR